MRSSVDTESLRLKVLNDLANARRAKFQEVDNVNAFKFGIGKSYNMGNHEIEFGLRIRSKGHYYDLTFLCHAAAQEGEENPLFTSGIEIQVTHFDLPRLDSGGKREPVFMGSRNSAKQTQHGVTAGIPLPSRIRLASLEYGVEAGGNIGALVLCDGPVEIVGRTSEGEMAVPFGMAYDQCRGGVSSLIERVSEVLDDIVCQTAYPQWKRLKSYDAINKASLIIELFDHSCRFRIIGGNDSLQVVKLGFRPSD